MDQYTLDFGAHGRLTLPIGGLLRVGDPSVRDAHLSLPLEGLHLLFHGVAEGVIVVNCSKVNCVPFDSSHRVFPGASPSAPFEQQLLKEGERVSFGPLEFLLLPQSVNQSSGYSPGHCSGHSTGHSHPVGAEAPSWWMRRMSKKVLGWSVALLSLGAGAWMVEWNRTERLEQIAALHLADTAIAMLADRIYGPAGGSFSGGSEVFYDPAMRDRWLDRILTVDTKRETVRGTLYTLHLDEEPETGCPRLVAEPRPCWWRRSLGLQHRLFSCNLSQPQLLINDSEPIDWEWLGGEGSGFVIPRRLMRRGFSPGPLYNAQRYRGFTWPLREIALSQPELLPQVFAALKGLPGLFLQVFPDRRCEQQLWQALANLGEEEALPWELSPELTPASPSRMVAEKMERLSSPPSSLSHEWTRLHSRLSVGLGASPQEGGGLERLMDAADREGLQAPGANQIVQ